MADVMSPGMRSQLMSRIQGRNTKPELALRRLAWSMGLRYRLHRRVEGTRPDMVFPGPRVAVFVDGCFWHCCPLHGVMPKSNPSFWETKLRRNVERDREADARLEAAGWRIIRLWEHEVEHSAESCAIRIADIVSQRVYRPRGGRLKV